MIRALAALVVCAIVGGSSPAAAEVRVRGRDAAEVARILGLLASSEPADQAWGARHAAQKDVIEAAPAVISLLRSQGARPPSTRSLPLCAALLDALVVLDPVVDGEALLPHAEFPLRDGVVVLLVRRPERHAKACLSLFDSLEPGSRAWRALGNALAAARTPGFAAAVVRELEFTLTVRVWSQLADAARKEPGGSVPGCGFRKARPDGFPPIVIYRLRDDAPDGERLLADGPRPVYYAGYEREDGQIWHCSSLEQGVPPHAARLEWLAAWGAFPKDLRERTVMDLTWPGRGTYVRKVSRGRDDLIATWKTGIRRLAASGLVAPGDPIPSVAPVRVEVQDQRMSLRIPRLPEIPGPRADERWPGSLRFAGATAKR